MSDNNDEFGAFLVGFIVGGLSGAVVALLFAPQSGEELLYERYRRKKKPVDRENGGGGKGD